MVLINQELLGKHYDGDVAAALSHFYQIDSLTLNRNGSELNLKLDMSRPETSRAITVEFTGVRQLEIAEVDAGNFRAEELIVIDITKRGMENINWQVWNHEDFDFKFQCDCIIILSAQLND
ncbi:MAG: hypothetical protein MnENMB40S_20550 [Rhizobiaceae bacterium MnEN-MB40S]|nr:MAG: hypothetical protein MnENMB40S_20550 [Rhizobiaceae bacterium MnEN-MB40S]